MIITKVGKYRLLKDYTSRASLSVGTLRKGTIIEITQVNYIYHKIFGPVLGDWQYWDLPVEPV